MSGNLYLMSDIHGYFIPFLQILKKIRFTDVNRMVILGDLVAIGPDSLGLLRFVMEHKNILALRGNHEQRLLQYFGTDRAAGIPDSTMRSWVAGDGAGIIRQMNMLSETGRRKVLKRPPHSQTAPETVPYSNLPTHSQPYSSISIQFFQSVEESSR